jgi:hypothetical protein
MTPILETELATFLTELSAVQEQTLSLLQRKGDMLAKSDVKGLEAIAGEEETAIARLQACLDRREQLLKAAGEQGVTCHSLETLSEQIAREAEPQSPAKELPRQIRGTAHQARLLQHQGLTNWVVTQRTMIHLSQMLEIVATRGKGHSTYNRVCSKEIGPVGGVIVDESA